MTLDFARGNRRNHQHDLFDAARGLFCQVGDGLGIGDIDSVAAKRSSKRMRTEGGGYRRGHLRARAERVEVDAKEVRIIGSKSALLRTLVAVSSPKTAGVGVPSFVPKWRARNDSNVRPPDS